MAPDAVEFGDLQEHKNEKGVSRNNVFLFRLTKFCNDFFVVNTLTKWCRIAASTVFSKKKLEMLSDRSQYTSGLPIRKRPCASEFPASSQSSSANCDRSLAS